jgi:hypothetical protein
MTTVEKVILQVLPATANTLGGFDVLAARGPDPTRHDCLPMEPCCGLPGLVGLPELLFSVADQPAIREVMVEDFGVAFVDILGGIEREGLVRDRRAVESRSS